MLCEIALGDKYQPDQRAVFLSGTQAITRILLQQSWLDRAAGLNTAGFVSGYRGSPLGGLDTALWNAKAQLSENNIIFQPGVNEELAATSVYGTQQLGFFGPSRHQGVFAAWYGKGPGVDRAGDALKHGNLAGTAPHGGVLVFAGDDHQGKSSTTAHQSEQALQAALIPILYPANVEEFLWFGAFGYALSRYAGLWAGFKCVNETADATMSVRVPELPAWQLPGLDVHAIDSLSIQSHEGALAQERRTVELRLPAAIAFGEANAVDRLLSNPAAARICIVSAGKASLDVAEALGMLGLDAGRQERLGIRHLKLGMVWPVSGNTIRAAAMGCREVLVVEDKRAFVEPQVKDALYHLPADLRPDVSGKHAPDALPLLASTGSLTPTAVLDALLRRFAATEVWDAELEDRAAQVRAALAPRRNAQVPVKARSPFFCSGCPHNRSTAVQEGSVALAGIGCHVMTVFMPHRHHAWPVQMGGEGANWVGAASFSETRHVFQNLGDGTYYHSGLLAIRAAIAAKVNITYKLLFNDAVAMTGGQPVEGTLKPQQIAEELLAEGVGKVVIVTEEEGRYEAVWQARTSVAVRPRSDFAQVQQQLSTQPGVTVLIYDQVCAAEKRRRRKRGLMSTPDRIAFINHLVCEGCGDCGAKSNCVSIHPRETEFGRKRRIDQSSCNRDFSCIEGFCPSFVTLSGATRRKPQAGAPVLEIPQLAVPPVVSAGAVHAMLISGIGGTGVVTIGAVLGMAAHLEGKRCSIMDMTGLSQKNGAVFSHLKIGPDGCDLGSAALRSGGADVLLACDMLAASSPDAFDMIAPGRTAAVLNSDVVVTPEFTYAPDLDLDGEGMLARFATRLDRDNVCFIDATGTAEALLGDSIGTNMFVVGVAAQRGLLPVGIEAIEAAIRLNGVAVPFNLAALRLGRWAAVDPDAVRALAAQRQPSSAPVQPNDLAELKERYAGFLRDYQNAAYADAYRDFVETVRAREAALGQGDALACTVARNLFKLMAYKDEYEVARLHSAAAFREELAAQFEGGKLTFHLAPPLLARRDPVSGEPRKMAFGSWSLPLFGALAKFRFLRGTAFDPFGYTAERREERALIEDYRSRIDAILGKLTTQNHALAVEIASLPQDIRGYGHVKARSIATVREREAKLLAQFAARPTDRAKAVAQAATAVEAAS